MMPSLEIFTMMPLFMKSAIKYIGIYIKKVREEGRGMGDRERG